MYVYTVQLDYTVHTTYYVRMHVCMCSGKRDLAISYILTDSPQTYIMHALANFIFKHNSYNIKLLCLVCLCMVVLCNISSVEPLNPQHMYVCSIYILYNTMTKLYSSGYINALISLWFNVKFCVMLQHYCIWLDYNITLLWDWLLSSWPLF